MTTTRDRLPLLQTPDQLETRLQEIPAEPGVYFMRDRDDAILYIGKSKKLRSRVRSYFRNSQPHTERIAMMVRQICDIEIIITDTETEALALEANLIKQHQPHFNVLLKDDKKYPYLCITWSEEYPRIFITRKRRPNRKADRYYGPYTDTRLLRSTLGLVKRIFPLRQRRKPLFKDRPCLNYDIGRCPGVCQQKISPDDYHQIVQKIAMIFQGRTQELIETLTQQMEKAAEELRFETAALIRDRITGLQSLGAAQKVSLPDDRISRDAIAVSQGDRHACVQLFQVRAGQLVGRLGFIASTGEPGAVLQHVLEEHYRSVDPVEIPSEILVQHDLPEGELLANWLTEQRGRKVSLVAPQRQLKADLVAMVARNADRELDRLQRQDERNIRDLSDLMDILDLPDLPHRIECYDISHVQGSDAVASQVVFLDGVPAKQHYRRYKIKNPDVRSGRSDDFASLAEVLGRRFRNAAKAVKAGDFPPEADENFPDLVVIDGGKGQLSSVVAVLRDYDLLEYVNVVSLAKQREEIFRPGESEPTIADPERPGVQLVRRARDEAHRFAVSFHRQQRTERMRRSRLDEIPGLGFQRQKELLAHFRSLDYIMQATPEQLTEVPGIGASLAQQIYDYFHA
jgi:excinuclease ABC subunit C